jgi:hypothetical protein
MFFEVVESLPQIFPEFRDLGFRPPFARQLVQLMIVSGVLGRSRRAEAFWIRNTLICKQLRVRLHPAPLMRFGLAEIGILPSRKERLEGDASGRQEMAKNGGGAIFKRKRWCLNASQS